MDILERNTDEKARDYVVRVLTYNIISFNLDPGATISENEIATMLGLSRTPVREAFIQLRDTNILEVMPQKGYKISYVNKELVEEARFLRSTLEVAVAKLTCSMASDEELQELEENIELQKFYYERDNLSQLFKLDNKLHKKMFEICKKDRIYQIMKKNQIHFDRVRTLSLNLVDNKFIVEDHQALLNAFKNRDEEEAVNVMNKHLARYEINIKILMEQDPEVFQK